MKKIILLLFLFSTPLFAGDHYLVEKPDGSVAIIDYIGGSDSLSDVVNSNGFQGYPISRLDPSTLPPRADRKYWKKNPVPIGSSVIVDTAKKQSDEAAQNVKEERKRALLKLTPTEYQEAKDLGLVK